MSKKSNVSALDRWHTNLNITSPFQCCTNTHLRNVCRLRWLLFPLPSLTIYHTHSNLQRGGEFLTIRWLTKLCTTPAWHHLTDLTGAVINRSFITNYGCNDMLFSAHLRWSQDVSRRTVINTTEGPFVTRNEMAQMICSFYRLTDMKTTVDVYPQLTIERWCDSTDLNASPSTFSHFVLSNAEQLTLRPSKPNRLIHIR